MTDDSKTTDAPLAPAAESSNLPEAEVARKRITPRDFTIKNVLRRIGAKGELFKPVLTKRQTLERARKELARLTAGRAG